MQQASNNLNSQRMKSMNSNLASIYSSNNNKEKIDNEKEKY